MTIELGCDKEKNDQYEHSVSNVQYVSASRVYVTAKARSPAFAAHTGLGQ